MPRELDTPRDVEDIYLARGGDIQAWRPIMTGDVFTGVEIPGVDDTDDNLAMITTHPCSMRGRHGRLKRRVSMARVQEEAPFSLASWPTMFPKRMPLPELKGEGEPTFYLADLEEVGRVATEDLAYGRRMACLSDYGLLLMLQRLVFAYTREIVDTPTLMKTTKHVLEEADLLEEWNERVISSVPTPEANLMERLRVEGGEFDRLLSESISDDAGRTYTLRDDLRDPPRRPSVRRAVHNAIKDRIDQLTLESFTPEDAVTGAAEDT